MTDKNNKRSGMGTAAAVVALTAVAGAAGAILANKELRKTLGIKATQALKVVSEMALKAEQEASEGLKMLHSKTKRLTEGRKPKPRKIKAGKKK